MTFASAMISALRQMHRSMGDLVVYAPVSGAPVSIHAVPAAEDAESAIIGSRVKSETLMLEMLAADITPARGATVTWRGGSYKIKTVRHPDPDRLIWLVECFPAVGDE